MAVFYRITCPDSVVFYRGLRLFYMAAFYRVSSDPIWLLFTGGAVNFI